MTSHQDQIQTLIAEIDEVLSQPSPRLPWVAFGETVTRARQVLERVRNYLVSLQQDIDDSSLSLRSTGSADPSSLSGSQQQNFWQALREEMGYLRSRLSALLKSEVEELRHERQLLLQDIRALELRRQENLISADQSHDQQQIITEFLQELMNRLQESLTESVSETLSNLEEQVLNALLLGDTVQTTPSESTTALGRRGGEGANSGRDVRVFSDAGGDYAEELETSKMLPRLTPAQRLEQMRTLQAQSDQMLMTLDSSLSVIFEALQSNLQTYQESLSQNIEKMHGLGQQGEVILSAWINYLTQQLSQATTSQLQSSIQLLDLQPRQATPPVQPNAIGQQGVVITPETQPSPEISSVEDQDYLFPFAGVELPLNTRFSETQIEPEPQPEPEEDIVAETETPADIPPESVDDEGWDAEDLFGDDEADDSDDIVAETAADISPESVDDGGWDAEDLFGDTSETSTETSTDLSESEPDEEDLRLDTQDLFEDTPEEELPVARETRRNVSSAGGGNGSQSDPFDGFSVSEELDVNGSLQPDDVQELLWEDEDILSENINQNQPVEMNRATPNQKASPSASQDTFEDFSNIFEEPNLKEDEQFIYASPDENLLPGVDDDSDDESMDSRFLVDQSTLEQLEAELAKLEKPESNEIEDILAEDILAEDSGEDYQPISMPSEEEMITFDNLLGELNSSSKNSISAASNSAGKPEKSATLSDNPLTGWGDSDVTLDDILSSFEQAENLSESSELDDNEDFLSLEVLTQDMSKSNPKKRD